MFLFFQYSLTNLYKNQVYDGWNTTGLVLYDNTMERKATIYSSSSKILVRFDRPTTISSPALINKSWDIKTVLCLTNKIFKFLFFIP